MNKKYLKRFFFLLSFSFLSLCFSAENICCEYLDDFAFAYPKDSSLSCPKDFNLSASFLWMGFYEEGLKYAENINININSNASNKHKLDFRPGFRIGASYFGSFLIDINWTYIRIKDNDFSDPSNGDLLGLFLPPNTGTLTDASSRISGDFNTLDINFTKPYQVSRYYISNPKIGFQFAWIDQDYHIRYYTIHRKHNVYSKNDFWGAGLQVGYDANFLLGKQFGIYTDFKAALLFGKFDISEIAKTLTLLQYELSDSFYKVVPNANMAFGLSWGKLFQKNKLFAQLKVGYEFHQWWSINQLRRPMDSDPTGFKTVSRGDLTFNGLVVNINIEI